VTDWSLISLPANWEAYVDHGLLAGTEYSYRMRAHRARNRKLTEGGPI